MTTLELGVPAPPKPKLEPTGPATEPVARQVIVWVGVSDPVMAPMRQQLPVPLRAMLDCCDWGTSHSLHLGDGRTMDFQRILYGNRALGYGIIVTQWETIADVTTKLLIPDYMSSDIANAKRILWALGLRAATHHLTYRLPA